MSAKVHKWLQDIAADSRCAWATKVTALDGKWLLAVDGRYFVAVKGDTKGVAPCPEKYAAIIRGWIKARKGTKPLALPALQKFFSTIIGR